MFFRVFKSSSNDLLLRFGILKNLDLMFFWRSFSVFGINLSKRVRYSVSPSMLTIILF